MEFHAKWDKGKKGSEKIIEDKFLDEEEVEPHVFELVNYLFAAVYFHYDYLDSHLPKESKLRASPLYIACSDFEFRGEAKIAYPWSDTEYTPQ